MGRQTPLVETLSLEEMRTYLANPDTRIIDSRMLEMYDSFSYIFQVLTKPGLIKQVYANQGESVKALDLFRLQYRNNPRNNPALYGLLDEPESNNG